MRQIDGDALKDALFQKHVHDGEELEPMLYLDDAMKVVDEVPTIDAIPVEWLKKLTHHNDSYTRASAKWVLGCWKRDKE